MSFEMQKLYDGGGVQANKYEKFDQWSNNPNSKDENGEKIEDFQMFDFNASTYSSDLKNFSQGYIDKYDKDNDSNMNFSEFIDMASNGKENSELLQVANEFYELNKSVYTDKVIPQNDMDGDGKLSLSEFAGALGHNLDSVDDKTMQDLKAVFNSMNNFNNNEDDTKTLDADELLVGLNPTIQGIDTATVKYQSDLYKMYDEVFNELDMDGNNKLIYSGEFASMLYSADLDLKKYAETLDVASSIDGKLDHENYNTLPMITKGMEGYEVLHDIKQSFYNEFYS